MRRLSPPYSRSNSSGASSSDALRLMSGSTSTAPRASRSMHSRNLAARRTRTEHRDLARHDLLQRYLDFRREVADEHDRSALAKAADGVHHRAAVADDLERGVGSLAAREIAHRRRHVDVLGVHGARGAHAPGKRELLVVDVDGDDVAAAFLAQHLDNQHADHPRADDEHRVIRFRHVAADRMDRNRHGLDERRPLERQAVGKLVEDSAPAPTRTRRTPRDGGNRRTTRRAPCGCRTG